MAIMLMLMMAQTLFILQILSLIRSLDLFERKPKMQFMLERQSGKVDDSHLRLGRAGIWLCGLGRTLGWRQMSLNPYLLSLALLAGCMLAKTYICIDASLQQQSSHFSLRHLVQFWCFQYPLIAKNGFLPKICTKVKMHLDSFCLV